MLSDSSLGGLLPAYYDSRLCDCETGELCVCAVVTSEVFDKDAEDEILLDTLLSLYCQPHAQGSSHRYPILSQRGCF